MFVKFCIVTILAFILFFLVKTTRETKNSPDIKSTLIKDIYAIIEEEKYSINTYNRIEYCCSHKTKNELKHAILLIEADLKLDFLISIGYAGLTLIISMIGTSSEKFITIINDTYHLQIQEKNLYFFCIAILAFLILFTFAITLKSLRKEVYTLNILKFLL